jgi:hypothetical protein
VVSLVFFFCANVGLIALWQRRVVFVAAFLHLLHLLFMAKVQVFNVVFEAQGLGVVLVSFVFALQRADYAVEFCVFAEEMLAVKF